MVWPFRTRAEDEMTTRECEEFIASTTVDQKDLLLHYLLGSAPTAFRLAVWWLKRMQRRASSGMACLICGATYPLPTVPTTCDGQLGFACVGHPRSNTPLLALPRGGN